ncbi:MAG: hypothetical protein QHH09_03545 [Microgenomates group bacterium]|nr:hypothetical protein [Microgenomates group bacterium]
MSETNFTPESLTRTLAGRQVGRNELDPIIGKLEALTQEHVESEGRRMTNNLSSLTGQKTETITKTIKQQKIAAIQAEGARVQGQYEKEIQGAKTDEERARIQQKYISEFNPSDYKRGFYRYETDDRKIQYMTPIETVYGIASIENALFDQIREQMIKSGEIKNPQKLTPEDHQKIQRRIDRKLSSIALNYLRGITLPNPIGQSFVNKAISDSYKLLESLGLLTPDKNSQHIKNAKLENEQIKPAETVNEIESVLRQAITENKSIAEFFKSSDIVLFGERHIDYAIPEYLLSIIPILRENGITSFGFEIPVTEENLEIINEINQGNLERVKDIDWSLGFGAPEVRQLKENFVRQLVENGIRVYAYVHWDKNFPTSYSAEESEKKAAEIIKQHQQQGKTAVLAGEAHVSLTERRQSPNLGQILKQELGLKTTIIVFQGGMTDPLEYDRSPSGLIRRAMRKITLNKPVLVEYLIKGINCDLIIVLPEKPLKSAQEIPQN